MPRFAPVMSGPTLPPTPKSVWHWAHDLLKSARPLARSGGVFAGEMAEFLSRISNPKLEKPIKADALLQAVSHVAVIGEAAVA